MYYDKFDTQTLAGMSAATLKAHYRQVKEVYLQSPTKDTRTQAYLSIVDGWIQKIEQEGETK